MNIAFLLQHITITSCTNTIQSELEMLIKELSSMSSQYIDSININRIQEEIIVNSFMSELFEVSALFKSHKCSGICYRKRTSPDFCPSKLCEFQKGLRALLTNKNIREKVRAQLIERLYASFQSTINTSIENENKNKSIEKLFSYNAPNEDIFTRYKISNFADTTIDELEYKKLTKCYRALNFFYTFSNRFTHTITVFQDSDAVTENQKLVLYHLKSIELLLKATNQLMMAFLTEINKSRGSDFTFTNSIATLLNGFKAKDTIAERIQFCLDNMKTFFDIYIIFGRLREKLSPRNVAFDVVGGPYRQAEIYDIEKRQLNPINHGEICQKNLMYAKELEEKSGIIMENKWFNHMRLLISLSGCLSPDELKKKCTAFIDDLLENSENDFTINFLEIFYGAFKGDIWRLLLPA